jgi:hypothetical protein
MISVFRGPDKNGNLLPLVIIAIGAEDIFLTADTQTPTSGVGLDPATAREIARRLVAFAEEIEREGQA